MVTSPLGAASPLCKVVRERVPGDIASTGLSVGSRQQSTLDCDQEYFRQILRALFKLRSANDLDGS
jgi:hypothetical protein